MKKLFFLLLSLMSLSCGPGVFLNSESFQEGSLNSKMTTYNYYLYVPSTTAGSIFAFRMDPQTGALTALTGSPYLTSIGQPASVLVDSSGQYLYCAHTGAGGGISYFKIAKDTGVLTASGTAPISFSNLLDIKSTVISGAEYVYGVASTILKSYSVDLTTGGLSFSNSIAVSNSAYNLAQSPDGHFLYIPNNGGTSVSGLVTSANGFMTAMSSVFATTGAWPNSIAISPNGKYAYVSQFSSPSVNVFSILAATGDLQNQASYSTGFTFPDKIVIDPTGTHVYLSEASAGNIYAYQTDPSTGVMTANSVPSYSLSASVNALMIDPTGKFLYASRGSGGASTIWGYAIDANSGALSPLSLPAYSVADAPGVGTIVKIAQ